MNEAVTKLQLIDGNKLNDFLDYVKKNSSFDKLKTSINTPTESKLEEALDFMHGENQKKNNNQKTGESIISFLKRKRKYKDSIAPRRQLPAPPAPDNPDGGAVADEPAVEDGRKIKANEASRKLLDKFLKPYKNNGKVQVNGVVVNYHDMVDDFSNNKQKEANLNLSKIKREKLLRELALEGMPTFYLRNTVLKEEYKKAKDARYIANIPVRTVRTPSPLPAITTTPKSTVRRTSRKNTQNPNILPFMPTKPKTPKDLYEKRNERRQ